MMKPLYLIGEEPLRIRLDGPALRIAQPAHADRRVPLKRISRVMVSGSVHWQTDALMACMDEGVPVVFLRPNGDLRARCIGVPSNRNRLAQRWFDFIDRPDWMEQYRCWRSNNIERAQRLCAMRMGWPARKRQGRWEDWFVEQALQWPGAARWKRAEARLDGLLEAMAIQALKEVCLADTETALRHLAPDLAEMARYGILPEFERLSGSDGATIGEFGEAGAMIRFVENARHVVDFHMRMGLQGMYRFLESAQ